MILNCGEACPANRKTGTDTARQIDTCQIEQLALIGEVCRIVGMVLGWELMRYFKT